MEASKNMVAAFGKAATDSRLDHVAWVDEHITYTANLKQASIDTIDLTDTALTYELYRETELVGEFDISAAAELTLKYESFFSVRVEPIGPLAQGLKDKSIKLFNEGYYAKNGEVLGLIGEEDAINQYLKEQEDAE